MKRPLLMVALIFAGGIVFADLASSVLSVFPLMAGGIALALLALFWTRFRPVIVWLLLFVAGAASMTHRQSVLSPHDLRTLIGDRAEIVLIRGILAETPTQRIYDHGEEEVWSTIGRVDFEAIKSMSGDWRPAHGRVLVSTPSILSVEFFGGRDVEIEGVLRQPNTPVAEGVFEYRKFLKRQGIYYQLKVSSTNDWRLAGSSRDVTRPLADRFGVWAKAALARGLPEEDEPLRLLWAMTLGWKTALTGEVSEPFMRSGTMHIFAISGLHIALIAGLLVAVLRVFRVPRAKIAWVVVPLLWFYTNATGWQASAIRSSIMMSVIIGGWAFRRPSDLVNSLAAAAFIILLWDPRQLFQAGFQLSFLVVFSLALIVPIFENLHEPSPNADSTQPSGLLQRLVQRIRFLSWIFPDPLLPEELHSRSRYWFARALRYFFKASTTSLAAWIGSIPVIAYYFNLLTPVSLLANLMVVPLSGFALTSAFASIATTSWLPSFAEHFNHSAWFFMLLMIRVSEWAATLPGAYTHVATPSMATFALYYGILFSMISGWLLKPKFRLWIISGLTVLASICAFEWHRDWKVARLTILPLSGGESVYFKPAKSSDDLLVDCGNESTAEFVLKPYLRGQGIDRPSNLLLTHGDIRNVGGARLVASVFPPRKVLTTDLPFRSSAYREATQLFQQKTNLLRTIRRGEKLLQWTVLHPDENDRFPQADDNTIVLLGEIDGVRMLLLSDLGKPGQNVLMGRYPDLRADIVVSGLPNQSEPLADAFLESLKPQLVIITDSETPASQRSSKRLRERLMLHDFQVLFAQECGAVTLTIKDGEWRARAMNDIELAGSGSGPR